MNTIQEIDISETNDPNALITTKDINAVIPNNELSSITDEAVKESEAEESLSEQVSNNPDMITLPLFPLQKEKEQSGGFALEAIATSGTASLSIFALLPTVIIPSFILISTCLYWIANKFMSTAEGVIGGFGRIGDALVDRLVELIDKKDPVMTPEIYSALLKTLTASKNASPTGGGAKRRVKGGYAVKAAIIASGGAITQPQMVAKSLSVIGHLVLPQLTNMFYPTSSTNKATISNVTNMMLSKLNTFNGDKTDPIAMVNHIFATTSNTLKFSLNPFASLSKPENIQAMKTLATHLQKGSLSLGGGDSDASTTETGEWAIVGHIMEVTANGIEEQAKTKSKSGMFKFFSEKVNAVELYLSDVVPRCKCLFEYVKLMQNHLGGKIQASNSNGMSNKYTDPTFLQHLRKMQKLIIMASLIQNSLFDKTKNDWYVDQKIVMNCIIARGILRRPICKIRYFTKKFDKYKAIFESTYLKMLTDEVDAINRKSIQKQQQGGGEKKRINYSKLSLIQLKNLAKENNIRGRSQMTTRKMLIDGLLNTSRNIKNTSK
jgi:hypothetical protein